MPGTPATTPNLAIPRYAGGDTATFPAQVNAISDRIDQVVGAAGRSIIDTQQTIVGTGPLSGIFQTMPTVDRVSNLYVPTYGILEIDYSAAWKKTNTDPFVAYIAAAIFINGVQLMTRGDLNTQGAWYGVEQQADLRSVGDMTGLRTFPGGLITPAASSSYVNETPFATGEAQGIQTKTALLTQQGGATNSYAAPQMYGTPCRVDGLTAGTYTVEIRFAMGTGVVTTAKWRRLRCRVLPY